MQIGKTDLGYRPLFLAPMEDVTDASFRLLAREFGASIVVTEFVNADAIIRSIPSTLRKMVVADEERPVAIQLYGRDATTMAEAAKVAEEASPELIDLNFGCPVKKVAGKGAGAGMLRDIPLMLEIIRSVANAVELPVTVKTRLGWDNDHIIIEELAEQIQEAGAQALTIHGRTRSQMYKGEADWEPIARVKQNPNITIPIIGNGDVTSGEIALERFETTGVDAVMVGRGAIGQPWIFEEMRAVLDGKEVPQHPTEWYVEVLKRMLHESIAKCQNELKGILHFRRHLAITPLFKGIPDFKSHRVAMLRTNTEAELLQLIDQAAEMIP
ncbi:MAG: tRNA dihydrouridine synthase DusB [Porphyromonas somerae]|uniref:tRNA dihydrouridine synthase DusB n=1 Tax=Porphyromonas somerae TaxID=322095 RepID=UPI0026EEBA08|nr:tRNA dihydrouridine synthase DusB [Porphyromonas somerae]MDD7558528.1 tRNA dihydrouridine synthase DusB [Porphyromonas somerae]MDY5815925.1 tRNA dihydrouridine synthase DusB [Porphyromonas somerae]